MWESYSPSTREVPIEIADGLLHVKAPPLEIREAVEHFTIEAYDPLLFPEAKIATEKLRQELRIVEFRRSPDIQVTEDSKLLFKAIDAGDLPGALKILESGVPASSQDSEGKGILHHATIFQKLEIINYFLSNDLGFDPNHVDTFGRTCLHFAAFSKRSELQLTEEAKSLTLSIASVLVDDPRIEVDAKDRKGRTPLSIAARAGLFSVVSMLLGRGANPNLSNEEGRTPLHLACLQGYTHSAECLLDAGAWIETSDRAGFRAIHFAAHGNHFPVAQVLARFGATLDCQSYSGKTPSSLTENKDIKWLLEGRKTSYTDPYDIGWIQHAVLGTSRLGMAMCPGRAEGNWRRTLEMDIQVIKENKVDTIVTTLTQGELDYMGMRDLPKRLSSFGLETIWFPLDQWIPTDVNTLVQLVQNLLGKIQKGTNILVHCNGRSGRVGMVITAILIGAGMPIDEALKIVRSVRQGILSNPAHLIFISTFESAWEQRDTPAPKSFASIISNLF